MVFLVGKLCGEVASSAAELSSIVGKNCQGLPTECSRINEGVQTDGNDEEQRVRVPLVLCCW